MQYFLVLRIIPETQSARPSGRISANRTPKITYLYRNLGVSTTDHLFRRYGNITYLL